MPDSRNPQRFADALRANAGPGGPELAVAFQEHELGLSRRLDQLQLSLSERISSARAYGQVATAASAITLLAVGYLVQSTFTLSGQVGGMQEQIRTIDQRIASMEQNLNTRIDGLVNSIDAIDNRTREMADRAALDAIEPESGHPDFPIRTLLSESSPAEHTVTPQLDSSSIVASARAAGLVAAIHAFVQGSQSLLTALSMQDRYGVDVAGSGMTDQAIDYAERLEAMRFYDEILRAQLALATMEAHGRPSSVFRALGEFAFDAIAFRLVEPYESFESLSGRAQVIVQLLDSSSDHFIIVDVSDGIIKSKGQADILNSFNVEGASGASVQELSGYVVMRRDLLRESFDNETIETLSHGDLSIDEFISIMVSKSDERRDRESEN